MADTATGRYLSPRSTPRCATPAADSSLARANRARIISDLISNIWFARTLERTLATNACVLDGRMFCCSLDESAPALVMADCRDRLRPFAFCRMLRRNLHRALFGSGHRGG